MKEGKEGKHNKHYAGVYKKTEQPILKAPELHVGANEKIGIEFNTAYIPNDLTRLVFCLAVFHTKESEIFKLASIDYRGRRFDLSGERMTRWINFDSGELFIFTDKESLSHYYKLYHEARVKEGKQRIRTQEHIFTWLAKDTGRLTLPMQD